MSETKGPAGLPPRPASGGKGRQNIVERLSRLSVLGPKKGNGAAEALHLKRTLVAVAEQGKVSGGGGVSDAQRVKNMFTLNTLTLNKRAALKVVRNKQTITALVEGVNSRPTFHKMVQYSVQCLQNLAVDEVSVEEIVDEGGVQSLQLVASSNPDKEDMNRSVTECLRSMCVNKRASRLVARKFGSALLLSSLDKHTEGATHVSTCHTLSAMMRGGKSILDQFVADGVIASLASVTGTNSGDRTVMAAASEALRVIAADPQHTQAVLESGAMQHVLTALKQNPGDALLARHAVDLIAAVSRSNPNAADALKQMGALDVLVRCLDAHPEDDELLVSGASALAVLAEQDDLGQALSNMTSGGTFEDQVQAMATVGSLALVQDNVDYIVSTGGVPAIVGALRSALSSDQMASHSPEATAHMVEAGCRGLSRLAMSPEAGDVIIQEGGVDLCLSVISGHEFAAQPKVLSAALSALSNCAVGEAHAVHIASSGAIVTTVGLMEKATVPVDGESPADQQARLILLQHSMELLSTLCLHEQNIGPTVEAGAIGAYIKVLQTEGQTPEVLRAAINGLGCLMTSPAHVQAIAEAGGLEAVVATLKSNLGDRELVEQSFGVLLAAANDSSNVERLQAVGAMDVVMEGMERHGGEVQELGAQILGLFATEQQVRDIIAQVDADSQTLEKAGELTASGTIKTLSANTALLSHFSLNADNCAVMMECKVPAMVCRITDALTSPSSSTKLNPANAGKPKEVIKHKLMVSCLSLLRRLLVVDADTAVLLTTPDASGVSPVSRILNAAQQNPDNTELAELAMHILRHCADNDTCVAQLVEAKVVAKSVALVEGNLSSDMLLTCAAVIGRLCGAGGDEALSELLACDGHAVVLEAVINSGSNPTDLQSTLGALNAICSSTDIAAAVAQKGGVGVIMDVMRLHPDDATLQRSALQCLSRLAEDQSAKDEMKQMNVVEVVEEVGRNHGGDDDVMEAGKILLDYFGEHLPAFDFVDFRTYFNAIAARAGERGVHVKAEVAAPIEKVYKAIVHQVDHWWTKHTKYNGPKDCAGSTFRVDFGKTGFNELEVKHCSFNDGAPDGKEALVVWKVKQSGFLYGDDLRPEWRGTHLFFCLRALSDTQTGLYFIHDAIQPSWACYQVCVRGWPAYIGRSLVGHIERDDGFPYPNYWRKQRDPTEAKTVKPGVVELGGGGASDWEPLVWQPDSSSRVCVLCKAKFTFFNRRHHCRACGVLVCRKCSKARIQLKGYDREGKKPVRVCVRCTQVKK